MDEDRSEFRYTPSPHFYRSMESWLRYEINKELAYRRQHFGVPMKIIPALTDEQKRRRDEANANPVVAKCGECLVELRQIMYFSCSNQYCPCTPGALNAADVTPLSRPRPGLAGEIR